MLVGNQGGFLPGPGPRLQKLYEKLIKPWYGLPFNSVHSVFTALSLHSRVPSGFVILFLAA